MQTPAVSSTHSTDHARIHFAPVGLVDLRRQHRFATLTRMSACDAPAAQQDARTIAEDAARTQAAARAQLPLALSTARCLRLFVDTMRTHRSSRSLTRAFFHAARRDEDAGDSTPMLSAPGTPISHPQ